MKAPNVKAVIFSILLVVFSVGPALAGGPYKGPIFDAMAQFDEKMEMAANIEAMKKAGVTKTALFARSRRYLGQNEAELLELRRDNPEMIILGAGKNWFHNTTELPTDYVNHTLAAVKKHKYAFVGEILFTHGDKSDGKATGTGEWYINPLGPATARLLAGLKPLNVPLMTHWEVYAWERDWPKFNKLYADHPGQVFIIPHMAFGSPGQVEQILTSHPNVYMTISKKFVPFTKHSDPAKLAKLGSSFKDEAGNFRPEWLGILKRFSNRLMFGTDVIRGHKWNRYGKKIKKMRMLGQVLDEEAARNIFYETALKVFGAAK